MAAPSSSPVLGQRVLSKRRRRRVIVRLSGWRRNLRTAEQRLLHRYRLLNSFRRRVVGIARLSRGEDSFAGTNGCRI